MVAAETPSPLKVASAEKLRAWNKVLEEQGLRGLFKEIAATEDVFPKTHTLAYFKRQPGGGTAASSASLNLAQDMVKGLPAYLALLRGLPVKDLEAAANEAATSAERICAGGGYVNLVLALGIIDATEATLMDRMIADAACASALGQILRPGLRLLVTPKALFAMCVEETGRNLKTPDPKVMSGSLEPAFEAVVNALGPSGSGMEPFEKDFNRELGHQLELADAGPVALGAMFMATIFDILSGFHEIVVAEKSWPATDAELEAAANRDVAAIREHAKSPFGQVQTARDYVLDLRNSKPDGWIRFFKTTTAEAPPAPAAAPPPNNPTEKKPPAKTPEAAPNNKTVAPAPLIPKPEGKPDGKAVSP